MENVTDRIATYSMSLAVSIALQVYIDLHCTWKHFREISGKRKCSIFHVFRFSLISRERFHVQRRSIYPWKAIEKAGDIGWFNFQSVSFSIIQNVENKTCRVFYVPFSTCLTVENGRDSNLNQLMSPAFSRAFKGYIDLRCTWKPLRVISEKPKSLKKRKEEKKKSGNHRKLLKKQKQKNM